MSFHSQSVTLRNCKFYFTKVCGFVQVSWGPWKDSWRQAFWSLMFLTLIVSVVSNSLLLLTWAGFWGSLHLFFSLKRGERKSLSFLTGRFSTSLNDLENKSTTTKNIVLESLSCTQQGLAKSDESIVLLFYVNSFVWWCNFWLIGLIEPFSTFRVNLTSPEELHDVHGMNCQSIYFSEPLDWMKKQVEDKIKGRVRIYYHSGSPIYAKTIWLFTTI